MNDGNHQEEGGVKDIENHEEIGERLTTDPIFNANFSR
jgi:hypothetical protein